jgi:hypothetical protein
MHRACAKIMGTHLRKLQKELKGTKLGDGKSLAGRGRLTDKETDNLQNYYGMTIRRNIDSEEKMTGCLGNLFPQNCYRFRTSPWTVP